MRKSNEQSLGEVINELIKTYKLDDKLNEVRLTHAWDKLMGAAVAKRTSSIRLKNKTLFLKINSASLREELFYSTDKIKELINSELEGEYVAEVKIS